MPELANLVLPIIQDVFSLLTTGLFEVPLDNVLQLALPKSGLNSLHLHDLLIETFLKIIVWIVKVTDSASHAGANIPANRTKNNNNTASHVLAAVVPGAFGDSVGSTITNTESFTSTTIGMEITTGGSIQACVSNNTGVGSNKASISVWDDNNLAAVHAFANVVVGLSREPNVQARQNKRSEGLSSASVEVDIDLTLEPSVAMGTSNVSGEHSAGAPVRVLDVEVSGGLTIVVSNDLFDVSRLAHFAIQIRTEFVNVDNRVLGNQLTVYVRTKERTIALTIWDSPEELVNVDAITLGNTFNLLGILLQEVSAADEVLKLGVA